MPTTPQQLVIEAKRLQRLQTRRSSLRKQLKTVEEEIRMVGRHIRALSTMDPEQQLPARWKGRTE